MKKGSISALSIVKMVLKVLFSVLFAVLIVLFFVKSSDANKAIVAKSEAIKLDHKNDSIATWHLEATLETIQQCLQNRCRESKKFSRFSPIQTKALLADSLQILVNDLQKQLAACASSSSKKVDKSQKVAVTKNQAKK